MSVESIITENLDVWTSAIKTKSASGRGSSNKLELYGIKKLRGLILELAISGKLLPQDIDDESAMPYIETLQKEKEALIKERNFRKSKLTSEIDVSDYKFKLPANWCWKKLGDLFFISSSSRVQKKDWQESGVPFYRAREIVQLARKGTAEDDLFISEELYKNLIKAGVYPEEKDIMVTGVGTIGVPYIVTLNDKFYFKDASVLIIKSTDSLYAEYIELFMKSPLWINSIHEQSMGTTVHTLTIVRANEAHIAIPPLNEQRRIVKKVNELMALCDQLESQTEASIKAHQTLVKSLLETLTNAKDADELNESWQRISAHFDVLFTTEDSIDQLKQTILQLAVSGKLVTWGENKSEAELKDHLSFGPRNGFSPKESPIETQFRVLKLGATSYGNLDLSESKSVEVDINRSSHLWLKADDILIQRGNSANFVGTNVLIQADVENVIYPDLMMKIRANDELSPEYLSLWLAAPSSRQFMWDRMTGTSGTMPKISKKVVESIPIIVPDLTVQEAIVVKVNRLFSILFNLKSRINELNRNKFQISNITFQKVVS